MTILNFQIDVKTSSDKSIDVLKTILKDLSISDYWKSSGKSCNKGLTWCDEKNNHKSRNDYIFLSGGSG